jgi:hypothetical protein
VHTRFLRVPDSRLRPLLCRPLYGFEQPGIRTAIERHPEWCTERYWGKRLAAVAIDLEHAPADGIADLLTDAWEGKAPARLMKG